MVADLRLGSTSDSVHIIGLSTVSYAGKRD